MEDKLIVWGSGLRSTGKEKYRYTLQHVIRRWLVAVCDEVNTITDFSPH